MTQNSSNPADRPHHDQAVLRRIRMRKEDSAYVYCILEASSGITSYTTVDYRPGEAHRDVELQIPYYFQAEAADLLKRLGDLVYELE